MSIAALPLFTRATNGASGSIWIEKDTGLNVLLSSACNAHAMYELHHDT
jgi:hypothetical protein